MYIQIYLSNLRLTSRSCNAQKDICKSKLKNLVDSLIINAKTRWMMWQLERSFEVRELFTKKHGIEVREMSTDLKKHYRMPKIWYVLGF